MLTFNFRRYSAFINGGILYFDFQQELSMHIISVYLSVDGKVCLRILLVFNIRTHFGL